MATAIVFLPIFFLLIFIGGFIADSETAMDYIGLVLLCVADMFGRKARK